MTTLIVTRGLPKSGKTTYANRLVLQSRGRWVCASRDDLAATLFRVTIDQSLLTRTHRHYVRSLLTCGWSVVVDAGNLRGKHVHAWARIAADTRSTFHVVDILEDVETCIARDAWSDNPVGDYLIRRLAATHMRDGRFQPPSDTLG